MHIVFEILRYIFDYLLIVFCIEVLYVL